mgnify:CR=1 FL=1
MTNYKTLAVKLFIVSLVAVGGWFSGNITVAATRSIDKRVFWQTTDTPTERGQYGSFTYPSSSYLAKRGVDGKPFTKMVGCIAGDYLSFVGGAFYCNDELLARPLVADRLDEKLPVFRYEGVIPEGKAFMVGSHPYSGDSRYLGFVDVETVKRVIPLW